VTLFARQSRCRRPTCCPTGHAARSPTANTHEQILDLIEAATTLRTAHTTATFQTLFSLLVVIEMRIGEAIELERADFDTGTPGASSATASAANPDSCRCARSRPGRPDCQPIRNRTSQPGLRETARSRSIAARFVQQASRAQTSSRLLGDPPVMVICHCVLAWRVVAP
jgi:hypothetical protein